MVGVVAWRDLHRRGTERLALGRAQLTVCAEAARSPMPRRGLGPAGSSLSGRRGRLGYGKNSHAGGFNARGPTAILGGGWWSHFTDEEAEAGWVAGRQAPGEGPSLCTALLPTPWGSSPQAAQTLGVMEL